MCRTKVLKIICILAATVVILNLAGVANAATTSDSTPYGPVAIGSAPGFVGSSLSKFDPLLGTLTKVTLTIESITSLNSLIWDNEGGIPTDVSLGIGASVTVEALGVLSASAMPLQTASAIGVAADNDGAPDFSGTDSFGITSGSASDIGDMSSTVSAVLSLFTGPGSFDAWFSSVAETFLTSSGGYGPAYPAPGETEGTITVTYDYEIPEPASVLLLGFGGLSIILRRKRNRK